MARRILVLALLGLLTCGSSGCLFMRHSTRVVREKEKKQAVRFESPRAEEYFLGGVHELQAHKQNGHPEVTAIPFLMVYSRVDELSDNAIYNDQISACDTDGDGVISMQESLAYRARIADRFDHDETAPTPFDSNNAGPLIASTEKESEPVDLEAGKPISDEKKAAKSSWTGRLFSR
jgi:hypothetical protein